jgi:DNA-binding MarR family transcriptional regulator
MATASDALRPVDGQSRPALAEARLHTVSPDEAAETIVLERGAPRPRQRRGEKPKRYVWAEPEAERPVEKPVEKPVRKMSLAELVRQAQAARAAQTPEPTPPRLRLEELGEWVRTNRPAPPELRVVALEDEEPVETPVEAEEPAEAGPRLKPRGRSLYSNKVHGWLEDELETGAYHHALPRDGITGPENRDREDLANVIAALDKETRQGKGLPPVGVAAPLWLLHEIADPVAALLLATVGYWFEDGRARARIITSDSRRWWGTCRDDLAEFLCVSPSTITRALRQLKAANWIAVRQDKRAQQLLLRLTDQALPRFQTRNRRTTEGATGKACRSVFVRWWVLKTAGTTGRAILLSQFIYGFQWVWDEEARKPCLRNLWQDRDGRGWYVATQKQLAEQTGLEPRRVEHTLGQLKALGLVEVRSHTLTKNKTTCVRLNGAGLVDAVVKHVLDSATLPTPRPYNQIFGV